MDAELRAALPHRVCGKRFHPRALRIIRETISEYQDSSRKEIARQVCDRLEWIDGRGQHKLGSAVAALLRFHRKDWIALPPPRHPGVSVSRCQPLPEGFERPEQVLTGPLSTLGEIRLEPVAGREEARLWNGLIAHYHYRGYTRLCGAQMRYLVHSAGGMLGAMSFSAAAVRLRERDRWIGWDGDQRRANRHLIANHSRFLILPWVRVPNLASHLLGRAARRVPGDFQRRYGYAPVLLESFVEQERFAGTCYRAANWIRVGQTMGRGRTDRRPWRQQQQEPPPLPIKSIWLYPLSATARQRLCTPAAEVAA